MPYSTTSWDFTSDTSATERKGDIISKITSDVTVVQFCITNTLQVAFREPFLIIGYMVALVKISWELTIFSAVFLPLTALLIGSIVKRLRKSAKEAQENFGDMTSLLDEALTGVKVIKGYNATGYITGKFRRINDLYSGITRTMAPPHKLPPPEGNPGISAVPRRRWCRVAVWVLRENTNRPASPPIWLSLPRLPVRFAPSLMPSATSIRVSLPVNVYSVCSTKRARSPLQPMPQNWKSSKIVSSSATSPSLTTIRVR